MTRSDRSRQSVEEDPASPTGVIPPGARQEGWQPIETALLGRIVLLIGGGWRHPFVGMRNGDHGACYLVGYDNPKPGWQAYNATHWMELPASPFRADAQSTGMEDAGSAEGTTGRDPARSDEESPT